MIDTSIASRILQMNGLNEGSPKEIIRETLKKAGWADGDIENIVNSLPASAPVNAAPAQAVPPPAAPQFVPPSVMPIAPVSTPTPTPTPVPAQAAPVASVAPLMQAPASKSNSGKVLGSIAVGIILAGLIGGSAYAYIAGVGPFAGRNMFVTKLLAKSQSITSASYSLSFGAHIVPMEAGATRLTYASATDPLDPSWAESLDKELEAIPSDLDASLTISGKGQTDTLNGEGNLKADVTLSGFSGKLDVDGKNIDAATYVRVNDFPQIFFLGMLEAVRGKWIKISNSDLTGTTTGAYAAGIASTTEKYKQAKAEAEREAAIVAQLIDKDHAVIAKKSGTQNVNGTALDRYVITFDKQGIINTYADAINAFASIPSETRVYTFSTSSLEYLKSSEFSDTMDYISKNSSYVVLLDNDGYPRSIESRSRFVPSSDTAAPKLAGKEVEVSLTMLLDDINMPYTVAAPDTSISVDEALNLIEHSTSTASSGYDPMLGPARDKGNDAKVKARLSGLRATAEIYYDTKGNYSTASSCSAGMFADAVSGAADYTKLSDYPAGTKITCNARNTAYAAEASLSTAGSYWCVDNFGASKAEAVALGTSTSCK